MRRECGGYERRLRLRAVLTAIEGFMKEFRAEASARLAGGDAFAAELLVREALNNAVLHGCESDPGREVEFLMRLNRRRLTIAVGDGGSGFDWRDALGTAVRVDAISGRGLAILRHYATRIRFNTRGNGVVILKRFV